MASAGASYNMTLTWALLLSCFFTYFLIVAFSRYTMVTGNTALNGFKTSFGRPVTIFILISLLFGEVVSCMGIMGVITEVLQEWSKPVTADGEGFSPVWMAVFFCAMLYYIFWQGKQSFFEKILGIFVFVMGGSFLVTMFMVIPHPMDVVKGLVPTIPAETNAFMIISGMVGTTMGGILYVVRSILVSEKGWTIKDMKIQRRDAKVSVWMMFFLSFAVMACAAGTMYPLGLKVDNAIDMVKLMEPLAGRLAVSVFVAGIVAAGLSSLFPIIILAPWLFSDFLGIKRDMTAKWVRVLVLVCTLCGLIVPVFGGRPVSVMIFSQTLAIIATPLVVALMMVLLNRKQVMGEHRSRTGENILMWITLAFTVVIAAIGVMGIFDI